MKEVLSQKQIPFAYVDITSGMGPLKQFLKLRDTSALFDEVRATHRVGIPTLFVDDSPYLIDSPEHAEVLVETLGLTPPTDPLETECEHVDSSKDPNTSVPTT